MEVLLELLKPTHYLFKLLGLKVSLKVTDNNGCFKYKINNNIGDGDQFPVAVLMLLSSTSACSAPHNVNFVSTSTGNGIDLFMGFWNGQLPLGQPFNPYNAFGVYHRIRLLLGMHSGLLQNQTDK